MSKHHKTRNQKIISDLRRKLQTVNSPTVNHIVYPEKSIQERKVSLSGNRSIQFGNTSYKSGSYVDLAPYLYRDLMKTALLVSSIIAAQFILFFLLKNHVIALPIAGF